ncbi:MAG TPA: sugar transporter, partial [Zunongwangia profunda]|nr:sugar transporter [Zunongwangia profunda]
MAHEEDHISDVGSTFDFKGFVLKVISYWKLILFSITVSLAVAYYNNVRKLPVYRLENLISIKDDQNPFFTSNTSLTFNWGGTSDKVNTAITILGSRTHNEEVVERLGFYIDYKEDGEYQRVDAYGSTPFEVIADTSKFQAIGIDYTIQIVDDEHFNISAAIPNNFTVQSYGSKEKEGRNIGETAFNKQFQFGEKINTPFLNAVIARNDNALQQGKKFYISFLNFDSAVSRYKNVAVKPESNGASVLQLAQTGNNKARIVDYLNGSVKVL